MKAREFTQSALRRWPLGALALVVALAFGLTGQVATTPLTADTNVPSPVLTKVHDPDHVPLPCFNSFCLSEQLGSVGPSGTLVIHDQATVVSSDANLNPTGEIQFRFYKGNLHCMGTPFSSEKRPITAVGGIGIAESSDTAPLPPGDYSYKAIYLPNEAARDKGFEKTPANCEQLRIIRVKNNTVVHFGDRTDPTPHTALLCFNFPACTGLPEQQGPANSIVHDQATVDSTQPGRAPTGKVTFKLYVGNANCREDLASAVSVEDVVVAPAPGQTQVIIYESSATLPLAAGNYSYKAVYYPDAAAIAKGIGSVPADCEQLLIIPVKTNTVIHFGDRTDPTPHTPLQCFGFPDCTGGPEQQAPAGSTIHDQATVDTTQANRTPTGTVQFGFWIGTAECDGPGPNFTEDVVISSGSGSAVIYESSSRGPLTPGDYSYRAKYTPDATAIGKGIGSSTSPCEQLKILAAP